MSNGTQRRVTLREIFLFEDEGSVLSPREFFDEFLQYIRKKYQQRAMGLLSDGPSPFCLLGLPPAMPLPGIGRHEPCEDPVFLALLHYLIETTFSSGVGYPMSKGVACLFLSCLRGDVSVLEILVRFADRNDPATAHKIEGLGRKMKLFGEHFREADIKWKGVLDGVEEEGRSITPPGYADDGGSSSLGSTIGIDIGTSYSCASVYKNGLMMSLLNEKGKQITPSCVAYTHDHETLIGEDAEDQAIVNVESVIFNVKRLIGTKFEDPEVQDHMALVPYKIVNRDGEPYIEVTTDGGRPEDVIALIIAKIKENAQHVADITIKDAVVTVPAYFNDAQRRAVRNACDKACINVAGIINEPTAAAIAYGRYGLDGEKTVLVFRLGAGTFDVSILSIDSRAVVVLATNGDKVGGEDFDREIMRYFIDLIKYEHGRDISRDSEALWRLRRECERAKRLLSKQEEVQVEIVSLCEGFDLSEPLTRDLFEQLNDVFFMWTIMFVDKTMKDAGLNENQIDEVILAGRSSRIPRIRQLLDEYFSQKKPKMETVADEAAAEGAAIIGAILCGNACVFTEDMLIVDAAPSSTGTGAMTTLIHRNLTMESPPFTTHQDQQTTDSTPDPEEEDQQTTDSTPPFTTHQDQQTTDPEEEEEEEEESSLGLEHWTRSSMKPVVFVVFSVLALTALSFALLVLALVNT